MVLEHPLLGWMILCHLKFDDIDSKIIYSDDTNKIIAKSFDV